MVFEKFFISDGDELNYEYIDSLEEFKKLKEAKQSEKWHSEGSAYVHTMEAVKAAYLLIGLQGDSLGWSIKDNRIFLMSVLLHDIGKTTNTIFKNGDYHSYGHEHKGAQIARRMLWDEDFEAREKVCSLIYHHMDRFGLMNDPIGMVAKLSYSVDFPMLIQLCKCDEYGSKPKDVSKTIEGLELINFMEALAKHLGCYEKPFEVRYKTILGDDKTFKLIDNKEKHNGKVTVMIGLSGSGKDTYISENIEDQNTIVICRDEIRADLGMCNRGEKILGDKNQEERVTKEFNKRLLAAAKDGKDIVINNINLKKKYRDGYKNLLKGYDYKWEYVYVEAPSLIDCYKRHNFQVPIEILTQMVENFDFPIPSEYDELKIIKQKNG